MTTKPKLFTLLFFVIFFVPFLVFAESPSTFPEEEAGIAIYTKLNEINEENNLEKITEAVAFLTENGEMITNEETHIIGKLPVEIKVVGTDEDVVVNILQPFIYLDLSGWIVVYFSNEDPASKIINWNNYSPENLEKTVLEEALEIFADELDFTFSNVKYYHFQYPEATRMAVIIDTVYNPDPGQTNSFSVTVPENIYDASYSVYYSNKLPDHQRCILSLTVDQNIIHQRGVDDWCQGWAFDYDFYEIETFTPNIPHYVVFDGIGGSSSTKIRIGAGTVLVYGDKTED